MIMMALLKQSWTSGLFEPPGGRFIHDQIHVNIVKLKMNWIKLVDVV